jgi:hypothetical protein
MATSASKSTANESSTTTDNRISTGDGALIAQGGSVVTIESLDANLIADSLGIGADVVKEALAQNGDALFSALGFGADIANTAMHGVTDTANTAMTQLRGFAEHTNDYVFGLGAKLLDDNAALTGTALNTLTNQAQSFNTTLRDTLSATLGSDNLAGSAEQSGGAAGFISRNPAMAAALAVGGFILALLVLRPRSK